ncbi:MAG: energy transducer TonB [Zoogloeaceae bacterium]|nr:energy transducer TonB [Zoogloeaceae bacterium]
MHAANALPFPGLRSPSPVERRFGLAALGLSLLIHGLALLLPRFDRAPTMEALPAPIVVTLLAPPLPASPPVTVAPRPVPPEPVAIRPAPPTPSPPRPTIVKAATPPPIAKALPRPVTPTAPEVAATAPADSHPASSPPAAPQAISIPAPPAATPTPIPAQPDPALVAGYRERLANLLAREQTYPRIAAARGWEGEVVLRVVIARKGQLVNVQVLRSSGHPVLDEHALALVADVQPFPALPLELPGNDLTVTVPVHYHLKARG